MKCVSNPHKRRKIQLICKDESKTDQSLKKQVDINNIVASYAKTNSPLPERSDAKYMDCTQIPDLHTAFETVQKANERFYELPAKLRKLIDNDPSQLEAFLKDQSNEDMLVKMGILEKKAQTIKKEEKVADLSKSVTQSQDDSKKNGAE